MTIAAELQDAIKFSQDHEVKWDRQVSGVWGIHQQEPAPWNKLLGPVHDRGPVSGAISVNGETLISWGEPDRADLTFSVAKTYLALLTGIAVDKGLIRDVHDTVGSTLPGIGFDDPHNARVTWHHLLQQTSEWQGEFFGMPDEVEHNRSVTFAAPPPGKKGEPRDRNNPGEFWEYNDVRINQLSFALLHLFRQPLADVFRDTIMRPIGASDNWRWVGYDHSWINIDGCMMPSVPGGSHWGGGVSISAHDQLRIAQLMLNDGQINHRQILSSLWLTSMRQPCHIAPFYGYLIWLNAQRRIFPSLPETSYFAIGAGGSFTWIVPDLDAAVVVRWLDAAYADAFFGRVYKALAKR